MTRTEEETKIWGKIRKLEKKAAALQRARWAESPPCQYCGGKHDYACLPG